MHFRVIEKVLIKLLELSKLNALLHDVLVLELEQRFPDHELMNVLEIIYPQYWCCNLMVNFLLQTI